MKSFNRCALLLTLALATACSNAAPTPAPVVDPVPVPVPAVVADSPSEPLPPLQDVSLYEIEATLAGEDGPIQFDHFRGHPVLVSMFYGSCKAACPQLIRDVEEIELALSPERRANLRVLLISFDPDRDTPEALRGLHKDHNMDPARWRLAAAPNEAARELAAVIGVRYRKLDNGEFFHTSVILLLDGEGVPRARIEGLAAAPDAILAAIP